MSAVLTAALAIGGLSACQTKVGQAAIVGSDRVSETDLGKYVTRSGASAEAKAAAKQNNQSIGSPKVQALSTILQSAVFEHALAVSGGVPSAAQLTQLHDEAFQRLLSGLTDARLASQVKSFGFTDRFAALVVRSSELEDALINRTKATNVTDLLRAINKSPLHISVSPRYGRWDPQKLALTDTVGAGLPSFVTFGPGAIAGTDQTNSASQ